MGTRSSTTTRFQSGPPLSQQSTEFKTEFHPRSKRPPLLQSFDEFRNSSTTFIPPTDDTPYRPFRSAGDFEFMEIALEASLNQKQVDALLYLIGRVAKGLARVTLKNDAELRKACDAAAAELTPFSRHEVTAVYKKESRIFEVHTRPVWEWALDILDNDFLAPHFVWDAQRLFKYDGRGFERFYDEPWTGDSWWDIQSSLPDVPNAVPFGLIVYADKTKLSSFGTAKGYPVVVRCANLPVDIRNSHAIGGGCVVGWLPVVPEDAEEEGKLGYTTLKRTVWHESFSRLLGDIKQYSKTGYVHTSRHDQVTRWLFPVLLILSADYEEQCMMSLIRGRTGKCPCPVCLVPLEELHDISRTYPMRSVEQAQRALRIYRHNRSEGEKALKALGLRPVDNVFWLVCHSDLYRALSFDRLHFLHGGLWGKHILRDVLRILNILGRSAETEVENYVANFPRWRFLTHFKNVINVTFSDGNKMRDVAKVIFYALLNVFTKTATPEGYCLLRVLASYLQLDTLIGLDVHTERTIGMINTELLEFDNALKDYVECVNKSGLEGLRVDWDFPKVHLWKHVSRDIRMKGATRNYSTRPNESMHGPIKEAYERRSNGRNVATQILRVDEHKLAAKLLRMRVDNHKNWNQMQGEDSAGSESGRDTGCCEDGQSGSFTALDHVYLGSVCKPSTMQDIEASRSVTDPAFVGFRKKLSSFCNECLPQYGYQVNKWIVFPASFEIREYRYLKVNYESLADWKVTTDHLRCSPSFYGQPRYDCALIQLTESETVFVRLISIFTCDIPDIGSISLAFVQPLTAKIGGIRRIDVNFRLTRVKAVPRSNPIFIPIQSIIRGAVVVPDPSHSSEFWVVNHIDADMFLRMEAWE
ncbi:hypothetical protein EDD15DRAFT_2388095 [Pisolithus albus]|nr:hypothetical protein EDD15DRAFT_2388095 [Pisolithus albus]